MTVRVTRLPDPPANFDPDQIEYINDLLRELETTFKTQSALFNDILLRLDRVSVLNP